MKLNIVFENSDLLVVNKPASVLVHGIYDKYGPRHTEKTLADYVAEQYPEVAEVGDKPSERPGVVHRLDRETSGVIVFARNQQTFTYLKGLFSAASRGEESQITKTYTALVWGRVKELTGVIDKPISIRNGSVKRTVHDGRMTRPAITEYAVQKYFQAGKDEFTLLNASPKTGRTHQIRVHLNAINHPVYGDKLYGKKGDIFELGRQFLHASTLEFPLANGERIVVAAEVPIELKNLLANLSPVLNLE